MGKMSDSEAREQPDAPGMFTVTASYFRICNEPTEPERQRLKWPDSDKEGSRQEPRLGLSHLPLQGLWTLGSTAHFSDE